MGKLKGLLWLLPISGLAVIVLGVVMFLTPLNNLAALMLIFGLAMLASGILELISYFSAEQEAKSGGVLSSGVLSALFGVWAVFASGMDAIDIILPFIFAAWVMATGVGRMVEATARKSKAAKLKLGVLIFGVLGTFSGFALLFNPWMPELTVSRLLGFIMAVHGTGTIVLFFKLKKQGKILGENQDTDEDIDDA